MYESLFNHTLSENQVGSAPSSSHMFAGLVSVHTDAPWCPSSLAAEYVHCTGSALPSAPETDPFHTQYEEAPEIPRFRSHHHVKSWRGW